MIDERSLADKDPELKLAMDAELARQRDRLELIASENLVSRAVLEAAGSVLTNKYAEGYPSKRYYGGCEYVDVAEELALKRAKALFGAEYANVQPHSGSQANMAAYMAVLKNGDTVFGMDLSHGGHLTHGSPVNFSGKTYNFVAYGVDRETEHINYEVLRSLALEHRPKLIVAGASAYPRALDFAKFRSIADECQALLMTDMAHIAGLVAAGEHESPLPHSHITTTTTHKTLRGPRGGLILVGSDDENTLGIKAARSGRIKRWGEILDSMIFPGTQGGPLMHIVAAKAVAFKEASESGFADYQKMVRANARALAGALADRALRPVSGGTDNHLILLDLTPLGVTGKDAETWLDLAGMTVNKNTIPFDPRPPAVSSGIRVGTPAITTRGLVPGDMEELAEYMTDALRSEGQKTVLEAIADKVRMLCVRYPVYGTVA